MSDLLRRSFTDAELEAFLDELLPAEEMAAIEKRLRGDEALRRRVAELAARCDAGVHSLGAIWRRRRVSCPTRQQLGGYLLGALDDPLADYIQFHLETIGCPYCQANLADLQRGEQEAAEAAGARRRRFFQSSAGRLRPS